MITPNFELSSTLRRYFWLSSFLIVMAYWSLALVFPCSSAVIGNRTVNEWLSSAKRVSVGTVMAIDNVNGVSRWRIAFTSDYFGTGDKVEDIVWLRELSANERAALLGSVGLFAVDHQNRFIGRTGSLSLRDVFPTAPERLSSATDPATRFCVDWLRTLAIPSNIIIRDLAVFSTYCASDSSVGNTTLKELQVDKSDSVAAAVLKTAMQKPSALADVLDVSNQLSEDSSAVLYENLGWALLSFRESSPVALDGLARLALDASNAYVRACAANALVVIHTEESWPHLTDLLFSKDREVRLLAISGLQQIVDSGFDQEAPRFESQVLLNGRPIQRQRRVRPRIDSNFRLRESKVDAESETALLGYWRSYALANR